jgi:hypothetical protein
MSTESTESTEGGCQEQQEPWKAWKTFFARRREIEAFNRRRRREMGVQKEEDSSPSPQEDDQLLALVPQSRVKVSFIEVVSACVDKDDPKPLQSFFDSISSEERRAVLRDRDMLFWFGGHLCNSLYGRGDLLSMLWGCKKKRLARCIVALDEFDGTHYRDPPEAFVRGAKGKWFLAFETPLFSACVTEDLEGAKMLVVKGVPVDVRQVECKYADDGSLHLIRDKTALEALVKHASAHLTLRNPITKMAGFAIHHPFTPIVRWLVFEQGADVSRMVHNAVSGLDLEFTTGFVTFFRKMLDMAMEARPTLHLGAIPKGEGDKDSYSPVLTWVAYAGQLSLFRYMVRSCGATMNPDVAASPDLPRTVFGDPFVTACWVCSSNTNHADTTPIIHEYLDRLDPETGMPRTGLSPQEDVSRVNFDQPAAMWGTKTPLQFIISHEPWRRKLFKAAMRLIRLLAKRPGAHLNHRIESGEPDEIGMTELDMLKAKFGEMVSSRFPQKDVHRQRMVTLMRIVTVFPNVDRVKE